MRKAISFGYRFHQTITCVLCIHINRDSLATDRKEPDDVISRILYFVEHHWNEMLKFSRSSEYAIKQWVSPLPLCPIAKKQNQTADMPLIDTIYSCGNKLPTDHFRGEPLGISAYLNRLLNINIKYTLAMHSYKCMSHSCTVCVNHKRIAFFLGRMHISCDFQTFQNMAYAVCSSHVYKYHFRNSLLLHNQ